MSLRVRRRSGRYPIRASLLGIHSPEPVVDWLALLVRPLPHRCIFLHIIVLRNPELSRKRLFVNNLVISRYGGRIATTIDEIPILGIHSGPTLEVLV